MANAKKRKSYDVGYGKPPKSTQFRKGRSGNPNGRPKGGKNFITDFRAELDERVSVREGGRERKLSKQRAFVKALMAKAMQGNVAACRVILEMMARLLRINEPEDIPLSKEDEAILDSFLTVQRRKPKGK